MVEWFGIVWYSFMSDNLPDAAGIQTGTTALTRSRRGGPEGNVPFNSTFFFFPKTQFMRTTKKSQTKHPVLPPQLDGGTYLNEGSKCPFINICLMQLFLL